MLKQTFSPFCFSPATLLSLFCLCSLGNDENFFGQLPKLNLLPFYVYPLYWLVTATATSVQHIREVAATVQSLAEREKKGT